MFYCSFPPRRFLLATARTFVQFSIKFPRKREIGKSERCVVSRRLATGIGIIVQSTIFLHGLSLFLDWEVITSIIVPLRGIGFLSVRLKLLLLIRFVYFKYFVLNRIYIYIIFTILNFWLIYICRYAGSTYIPNVKFYIRHEETLQLAINKQFKVSKRIKRIYTLLLPLFTYDFIKHSRIEAAKIIENFWETWETSLSTEGEGNWVVWLGERGIGYKVCSMLGYVYTCLSAQMGEFVSTMEMNILIGTRLADSSSFIDKVILIITLTPPLLSRRASLFLSLSLIF